MWWFALIVMNVIGYTLMGIDKRRAIQGKWRISEKALFTCAACFGSFGVYAGMQQFRHKTKHWSFKIVIPGLMVVQALMISYVVQTINRGLIDL